MDIRLPKIVLDMGCASLIGPGQMHWTLIMVSSIVKYVAPVKLSCISSYPNDSESDNTNALEAEKIVEPGEYLMP